MSYAGVTPKKKVQHVQEGFWTRAGHIQNGKKDEFKNAEEKLGQARAGEEDVQLDKLGGPAPFGKKNLGGTPPLPLKIGQGSTSSPEKRRARKTIALTSCSAARVQGRKKELHKHTETASPWEERKKA